MKSMSIRGLIITGLFALFFQSNLTLANASPINGSCLQSRPGNSSGWHGCEYTEASGWGLIEFDYHCRSDQRPDDRCSPDNNYEFSFGDDLSRTICVPCVDQYQERLKEHGDECVDNSDCLVGLCRDSAFGGKRCLYEERSINDEATTRCIPGERECGINSETGKNLLCDANRKRCIPIEIAEDVDAIFPFKICDQIGELEQKQQCNACLNADGLWTAVGCINREPTNIVRTFVRIGLGLAGGTALLIILASAFMLSTSQGDPKKVGDAKEMLTAAIIGILFVVFSIVVLQFIGVTILQIPGFGDS